MLSIFKLQTPLAALGLSGLVLAGCAVAPTEPTVMALPKQGMALDAFQGDDYACRDYAGQTAGGQATAQATNNAAVGTAAVGTAIGAVAGAALGSLSGQVGAGAAVGGAVGLLAGSAVGANEAQAGATVTQHVYDIHYTQCMVSKGYSVEAQPPPVYAYPAYGNGYPGPFFGPSIGIGFGGGYWGGGYGDGGYRRPWGGYGAPYGGAYRSW